jgi:poly(hydroxyalkanoate) granule-associated protein
MATHEVELEVKQIEESKPLFNGSQVIDVVRKLVLAGVGAVALSNDEVQSFVNRLVERGEVAQKDAEKLMKEFGERFNVRQNLNLAAIEAQPAELSNQLENGLERILNRLNVPSKRDIDELSAKIAQLTARVEELRKSQEVIPAKSKTSSTTAAQN